MMITGGAGLIGSNLVDVLLSQGKTVICVDNFNDFYDPSIKEKNLESAKQFNSFHLYRGDITDAAAMETIFRKHSIECVVNLAARAGVRPSNSNTSAV